MLLHVIQDAGSRFRSEWFDRAFRQAEERGATLVARYDGSERTFTGVDLGVGQTSAHDESVLFTIALLPDGSRLVLSVEAGHWQAPELVARVRSTQERYRSRVRVETNAAQAYIAQFLASQGVMVDSHTTGRNRHDPIFGIESLAVELEQGRWIVPDDIDTRAWARELIGFSPASHPGDRVVASWLAREAAREYEGRPRVSPFPQPGEYGADDDDDDCWYWVIGPNAARPILPEDRARASPMPRPQPPPRKRPPFLIR
jgi:hypothetical protein